MTLMGFYGNGWEIIGFSETFIRDFVGLLCNFMGFYGDQWELKQKKKQGTMWGPQDPTITVEFMGDI